MSKATPAAPIPIPAEAGESLPASIARTVIAPSFVNARTIETLVNVEGVELPALIDALGTQTSAVASNNLNRPAAVLTAQAHTLDALFNSLARLAFKNTGNLEAFDRIMRLALRAQAQTRETAAAIGVLKNPPTLIARQTNVAHGPQQVNNGQPALSPPSAPNELLETPAHGERLDGAASSETNRSDPSVATVGAGHGADHARG